MIIFDSKSELFRYPQGAVKENEKITLKIYIKRDFLCIPKLLIEKREDYIKHPYKSLILEWISTEKNYDIYGTEFCIEEFGNYFYSFEFELTVSPESLKLFLFISVIILSIFS